MHGGAAMNANTRSTLCLVAFGLLVSLFTAAQARADGFYMDVAVSVLDERNRPTPITLDIAEPHIGKDGVVTYQAIPTQFEQNHPYDITDVRNPYVTVSVGWAKDFECFSFRCTGDISAAHRSSAANGEDRGTNSLNGSLRVWFGGN
jgi:hypothetical protein